MFDAATSCQRSSVAASFGGTRLAMVISATPSPANFGYGVARKRRFAMVDVRHCISVICLSALGVVLTTGDSSQAAIPAMAGDVISSTSLGDSTHCFRREISPKGRVTNIGSGTDPACSSPDWCITTYATPAGMHSSAVNVGGPTPTCRAETHFGDGTLSGASSFVSGTGTLSFGPLNVPSGGSLLVCCNMLPGSFINSMVFN
jgi:hypothetical protein